MRSIELFFRGEFWLHLATMFIVMVLLIQLAQLAGIYLPNYVLFPIPLIVGIIWEFFWKKVKHKPISISDIIGTVLGGVLAILILKFI